MAERQLSGLSEGDIVFLVDTVDPQLMPKIGTIKGDPSIIEGMLDQETERLFQRIMLMGEEGIMASITPRLLFEVLLRKTLKELGHQTYTVERTASQRIPVFDTTEVVSLLGNKAILRYLAEMLSSFTKIESYTIPLRVRAGIWRKISFNDMDIDCLNRLCQAVDEEHRFSFYKRIGDVCLFILGLFPEYTYLDYSYPSSGETRPRIAGRVRRSAEDYEEEGVRFYKLAAEHEAARGSELSEALRLLHENFNTAKKPINFISEHYLRYKRQRPFGM